MRLKEMIHEDYSNYRLPSMFLGTCFCTWKCCKEQGVDHSVCQNSGFGRYPIVEISDEKITELFLENPLSKALVIGGLEPFEQWEELQKLVLAFRARTEADVVIYTGFYPDEIQAKVEWLKRFPNVIIKFGRYKQGDTPHFDEVLGVELANKEQFAERIS